MILQYPAFPSVEKVKCIKCHDCGELASYQEEYNVGWYWEFCNCAAGVEESNNRHSEAGYEIQSPILSE